MPKKIVFTQEMIDDLSKIGDKEFAIKWNIYRTTVIYKRKELGRKSFNKQHNTREHTFEDGIEYKYCSHGHWDLLENFGICKTRIDKLRPECRKHSCETARKSYYKTGHEQSKKWLKTEKGKQSRRTTWRKQTAKKKDIYVSWTPEDEKYIYNLFNGSCAYCCAPTEFNKIEFDHFIPIALGGKTQPSNMLPVCVLCNHGTNGKFKSSPKEWLIKYFGDFVGLPKYEYLKQILETLKP